MREDLAGLLKNVQKVMIYSKTDANGVILEVSRAFCKISGYSKKELIGKKHGILKHPELSKSAARKLRKATNDTKPYRLVFKNLDKSGKTLYLDTLIIPILNEKGEICAYASFSYDVSKFFEANDELISAKNELHQMNENFEQVMLLYHKGFYEQKDSVEAELRTNFSNNEANLRQIHQESTNLSIQQTLVNLAHQWRQPLNELGIALFELKNIAQRLNLANSNAANSNSKATNSANSNPSQATNSKNSSLTKTKNTKNSINSSQNSKANSLNSAQNDLNLYYDKCKTLVKQMSASIDSFANSLSTKTLSCFSIMQALKEVMDINFEVLENAGASIEIQGKDYQVFGVKDDLLRVFYHLFMNAIEAYGKKKNKNIFITLNKFNKNYVKISVKDKAGGILFLNKVFQPFWTTKHPVQGAGLDLYFCKQIIENMQGQINANNDKKGACFNIYLKECKGEK